MTHLYYEEFGPGGRMAILKCEQEISSCLIPIEQGYKIVVYQHGQSIYEEYLKKEEIDGLYPLNKKEISIYLESAKIKACLYQKEKGTINDVITRDV